MAVRADDTKTGHGPHECMEGRRLRTKEIPRGVMRCGSLRNLIIRTGLHRVDEIRELNSVLDEKDWDVVANDI